MGFPARTASFNLNHLHSDRRWYLFCVFLGLLRFELSMLKGRRDCRTRSTTEMHRQKSRLLRVCAARGGVTKLRTSRYSRDNKIMEDHCNEYVSLVFAGVMSVP